MKFSPAIRTLLALMLCLLLPLQAGATLARATAMARHAGMPMSKGMVLGTHDQQAIPSLAHGAHPGHDNPSATQPWQGRAGKHGDHNHHSQHRYQSQHSQHDHTADGGHEMTPADSDTDTASHKNVHAKAGCADCAKCCLLAASAPPPALAACFAPDTVRLAFHAQRAPAPAFLTDGPERPPRLRIA